MYRIIAYITAASTAFLVGLITHGGIATLGSFAIDRLWDVSSQDEARLVPVLADQKQNLRHSCGYLVVSVPSDGTLYLGREELGSLDDTSILTATIRTIFERREQLQLYAPAPDLSLAVPKDRQIEKTVYIKAARSLSYGEIADLVSVIKEAGAAPIELVVDRPIRSR